MNETLGTKKSCIRKPTELLPSTSNWMTLGIGYSKIVAYLALLYFSFFIHTPQVELIKQEKEIARKELEEEEAQLMKKRKDPQQKVKEILQERIDLYKIEIEENELNLRRNIILGGVLYFDMLEIPPQPKKVGNWIICQMETPQVLSWVF